MVNEKRSQNQKMLWLDPEYRQRMSDAHKGYVASEETKKKISAAGMGRVSGMKGKTHSAESRAKMSKSLLLRVPLSEESRKKISNTLKGQHFTDERRKNISDSLKGNRLSEDTKKKISETHRGMKRSPEACKRMSEVAMGRIRSPETRSRMSIAKKKMFQDDIAYITMMAKSWNIKPNKPETLLHGILETLCPGEWKYTGDFSFTINGKCPDFVNCNGQKKIIELFGDYWHRGQNPEDRAEVFRPFGFDTLVIWEHELRDIDAVKSKITGFSLRKDTLECVK